MRYVRLGRSNLEVSRLGLDCQSLGIPQRDKGWDPLSYDGRIFAVRTVHAALDAGINVFDASPDAGHGRGESLLGEALRGRRNSILLTTKLIHVDERPSIEERVLASLRRLRTDWIDVLFVNDQVIADRAGRENWLGELQSLSTRGIVRHIGLLVTDATKALPLIESGQFEVAQMHCDVTSQGPAWDALDACRSQNMGVSIDKPVATGTLESIGDALGSEWSGKSDIRRCCFKYLLSDRRVHMINVGMRWEYEVAENTTLFSGLEQTKSQISACA